MGGREQSVQEHAPLASSLDLFNDLFCFAGELFMKQHGKIEGLPLYL